MGGAASPFFIVSSPNRLKRLPRVTRLERESLPLWIELVGVLLSGRAEPPSPAKTLCKVLARVPLPRP